MLSVCIITKNESAKLERCLESLGGYPVEVVVVDTGSTDGTQEMLRRWQKRAGKAFSMALGYFEWCGDFAKARNYAASLAKNDGIVMLDSDEIVARMDAPAIEKALNNGPGKIGRLLIRDMTELGGAATYNEGRLSRIYDRRYCRYEGRIHEQIVAIDGDVSTFNAEMEIVHDGYVGDEAHHRAKSERNIALLEAELREKGDDPYVLYHLAKNYCRLKDYGRAAEVFSQALAFDLDPRLEYVTDMVELYGYALINAGQADVALGLESVCGEFGHLAEFRVMMGHVYMHNYMFDKGVDAFLSATQVSRARTEGANTFIAYYNAGVVCEGMGQKSRAAELYKQCGEYPPAKARIKFLAEKP